MGSPESALLAGLAQAVADRICKQAIRHLQKMPGDLDGNGFGFHSGWECVCAQRQDEDWTSWDAWEISIHGILEGCVEELPRPEQEALWLQTDAGLDWRGEEHGLHAGCPVNLDQIVRHLAEQHLYPKAHNWSNARIRAYLEHAAMRD